MYLCLGEGLGSHCPRLCNLQKRLQDSTFAGGWDRDETCSALFHICKAGELLSVNCESVFSQGLGCFVIWYLVFTIIIYYNWGCSSLALQACRDKVGVLPCLRGCLETWGRQMKQQLGMTYFAWSNMRWAMRGFPRNRFWSGLLHFTNSPGTSYRLPTQPGLWCLQSLMQSGRRTLTRSWWHWSGIFPAWTVLLLGTSPWLIENKMTTWGPTPTSVFWTMWLTRGCRFMTFSLLLRDLCSCHTGWRLCFIGAEIQTWVLLGFKMWVLADHCLLQQFVEKQNHYIPVSNCKGRGEQLFSKTFSSRKLFVVVASLGGWLAASSSHGWCYNRFRFWTCGSAESILWHRFLESNSNMLISSNPFSINCQQSMELSFGMFVECSFRIFPGTFRWFPRRTLGLTSMLFLQTMRKWTRQGWHQEIPNNVPHTFVHTCRPLISMWKIGSIALRTSTTWQPSPAMILKNVGSPWSTLTTQLLGRTDVGLCLKTKILCSFKVKHVFESFQSV